jgi:hypothetical protein
MAVTLPPTTEVPRFSWRIFTASVKYLADGSRLVDAMIRLKKRLLHKPGLKEGALGEDSLAEVRRIGEWFRANIQNGANAGARTLEGDVLVESFFEHPGCNYNNFLLSRLIRRHSRGGKTWVLTRTTDDPSIAFWKTVGDFEFVSLAGEIRLATRLRALREARRIYRDCHYDPHGDIRCEIEGRKFGDLVYDDLLRKANLATCRRRGLLLLSAIYSACLRYLAYRDLIRRLGVQHVISSHDVYSDFGLLFKAVDDNVSCWNWYGSRLFAVNLNRAAREAIRKPRTLEPAQLDALLDRGEAWIEREFASIARREFSGELVRNFDDEYVLRNNEIGDRRAFEAEHGDFLHPGRRKVMVMAHVFVDAVNYSPWRLFSDYYTWLEETLTILGRVDDVDVFVKPHPAEAHYGYTVSVAQLVDRLARERGLRLRSLTKKVSNEFLMSYADAFLTACGTVAMQAPCFGKTVVVAASIPSDAARAVIQPRSIEAYRAVLAGLGRVAPPDAATVLRAKAAYIHFSRLCYADTRLNTYTSARPDCDRASEYRLIRESLEVADPIRDELLTSFERDFIRDGRVQTFIPPREERTTPIQEAIP